MGKVTRLSETKVPILSHIQALFYRLYICMIYDGVFSQVPTRLGMPRQPQKTYVASHMTSDTSPAVTITSRQLPLPQ